MVMLFASLSAPPGLNAPFGYFCRIERALQIVVQRIAVEQRGGIDQNQSFIFIDDVKIGVERMDRLFFIDAVACARRRSVCSRSQDRSSCRQSSFASAPDRPPASSARQPPSRISSSPKTSGQSATPAR